MFNFNKIAGLKNFMVTFFVCFFSISINSFDHKMIFGVYPVWGGWKFRWKQRENSNFSNHMTFHIQWIILLVMGSYKSEVVQTKRTKNNGRQYNDKLKWIAVQWFSNGNGFGYSLRTATARICTCRNEFCVWIGSHLNESFRFRLRRVQFFYCCS